MDNALSRDFEKETRSTEIQLAVIQRDIQYIKSLQQSQGVQLSSIDTKVGSHYVTKEEFAPIKNLVYGLVALMLIAVVGALLSLVVIKR